MNPIPIFQLWFNEELTSTKLRIPSACCLSTNGSDGYPNARYVSLKHVTDDAFIITGPLTSRKGLEIQHSDKVALSFWWTETERQVRIQGEAVAISNQLADKYFYERSLDAQIISVVSRQGEYIEDLRALEEKYDELKLNINNNRLYRPAHWGGYAIYPKRIEFMAFKDTRFHNRELYELTGGNWSVKQLQP